MDESMGVAALCSCFQASSRVLCWLCPCKDVRLECYQYLTAVVVAAATGKHHH